MTATELPIINKETTDAQKLRNKTKTSTPINATKNVKTRILLVEKYSPAIPAGIHANARAI
jgi:hypothetical protein